MVLDMRDKLLYFCDSKGDYLKFKLLQISRYLSFEYIMRTGNKLDLPAWRYVECCTQLGFLMKAVAESISANKPSQLLSGLTNM